MAGTGLLAYLAHSQNSCSYFNTAIANSDIYKSKRARFIYH